MSDVTIEDLRQSALRKGDQQGYGFIQQDELDLYLQEGLSELHDIVITADPKRVRKIQLITPVSDQEEYDLADDFCKMVAIWHRVGSTRYEMHELTLREVPEWQRDQIIPVTSSGYAHNYTLVAHQILISPEPRSADGQFEIWYAPQAPKIDGTADQKIGYQFLIGHDEYISNHAAACILRKEQQDFQPYAMRNRELGSRFMATLKRRDKSRPGHVVDVYNSNLFRSNSFHRRGRF